MGREREAGKQENKKTGNGGEDEDGFNLEYKELSEKIIGAAIEVHRTLGPGFIESIYESALCIELMSRNISFVRQPLVGVHYRGHEIGQHRLDLIVEGRLVIELKAIKEIEGIHYAIVRSYCKASGLRHGLIFNFASIPLTIKRVFI